MCAGCDLVNHCSHCEVHHATARACPRRQTCGCPVHGRHLFTLDEIRLMEVTSDE